MIKRRRITLLTDPLTPGTYMAQLFTCSSIVPFHFFMSHLVDSLISCIIFLKLFSVMLHVGSKQKR